ncbi:MAG: ComEC/Rec2 family competence protein [Pseudoflavonifractor sp.]|nr:ComEC/Rec2 family competence protein [Alloprevotella sp.]MCM1116548.1 ComEC/Rec2 family competence protein [Pseudoflavonifractor sp.]
MPRSSLIQPRLSTLPALPITIAFASGIIAATGLHGHPSLPWVAIAMLALAIMGLCIRHTRQAALLMIISLVGMADYYLSERHDPIPKGFHTFTALVTGTYETASSAMALKLSSCDGQSLRSPLPVTATLSSASSDDEVSPGYSITLRAAFLPNSHDSSDIRPNYSEGIAATAYISPTDIIATAPAPGLIAASMRLRSRLVDHLYASELTPQAKEFLATALLGDKNAVDRQSRKAFSRAGLAHILALSGLHLAIIAGLLYWLLAPMSLIVPRHFRSIVIILFVWGYALVTGLGAPVVRAAFMTSIVLMADLMQRRSISLNSLFAAALVILVFSPQMIADIGFQLSFLAVAAIVTLAIPLSPFSTSPHRLLVNFGETIGISIAAMLATGFIAAMRFHSFPLLFLPANVIVTPLLMPALLACGLVILAAETAGLPCSFFIKMTNAMVELLNSIADLIASLPFASLPLHSLSTLTVSLALLTAAAAAVALWHGKPKPLSLIPISLLSLSTLTSAAITSEQPLPDPPGAWHVIPHTRHVAIVIPDGHRLHLLTDAPPTIADNLRLRLNDELADYALIHGHDSLSLLPDTLTSPTIIRRGNHLLFHQKYIRIVNAPSPVPAPGLPRPSLLVIAQGFRGSTESIINDICPREIMIASTLNPRLRQRIVDSISARGIPFSIR